VSPISRLAGRVRALVLACATAGAVAPRGARAEEPDPTAASTSTETTTPTEDIVVVGTRRRTQAAQDPTAAATVIEAERYAGEAKGVAELVATAPGVAVSGYGGLGQLATVSIRGSTSSGVLVLLDGLPLNTAAGGGVDLSTIPRAWISRIEIARGAEGAAYGVGALGGVVNVVTARPEPGAWSAEASGGSFETFLAAADRAWGDERWSVLGQATAEGSDGDFTFEDPVRGTQVRHNNGALRGGALVKVAGRLGERRLDALAQVTVGHRELAGWPYTSDVDWQRDARAIAMARLAVPGPRAGLVLAGRAHLRGDLLDISLEDVFAGRVTHQRGGVAGAAGEALWAHRAGELRAMLSAEGEALSSDAIDGTRTRASLAVALSDDLALAGGRVRIAPAVRADRVGPFAGLSAKLGASVRAAGPVALRASAGTSFRPPSFAELHLEQGLVMPNPDLRAEEGIGADAGVVVDGRLGLATLGGHATLYRDLIQYEATAFGRLYPRNAGKALVAGLEAEAASAPLRAAAGLSLSVSYTLLATENLRGSPEEVGKELPFRPRHRLFARAAIAPGPATAHVEVHWVDEQFEDTRNASLPVPAALVWNAGASLRAVSRPDVRVHLEIRNLLDDRTLREPFGGPLPGRTVMLTVRAGPPAAKGSPTP
jgi:iron complex outermembrane receptor protein